MQSGRPSDEMDTIAYAASFLGAAERLAETEWTDNHTLIVPFYMLIGFSLENGLKAVLEFSGTDRSLNWFHSHDLTKLRQLAEGKGLTLDQDQAVFIDELSPLHKEHHFRYPQKAATAALMKPPSAVVVTNAILSSAFLLVGGPFRLDD